MIGCITLSVTTAAKMESFLGWANIICLVSHIQATQFGILITSLNLDVMNAFAAWPQLYANLYGSGKDRLHTKDRELIGLIIDNHDGVLHERSQKLNEIIGGRVSVLPPDTRHVDYEVIPVMISDGCLYHCDFCCVKSTSKFRRAPGPISLSRSED